MVSDFSGYQCSAACMAKCFGLQRRGFLFQIERGLRIEWAAVTLSSCLVTRYLISVHFLLSFPQNGRLWAFSEADEASFICQRGEGNAAVIWLLGSANLPRSKYYPAITCLFERNKSGSRKIRACR